MSRTTHLLHKVALSSGRAGRVSHSIPEAPSAPHSLLSREGGPPGQPLSPIWGQLTAGDPGSCLWPRTQGGRERCAL